jgi:hypothetical protein
VNKYLLFGLKCIHDLHNLVEVLNFEKISALVDRTGPLRKYTWKLSNVDWVHRNEFPQPLQFLKQICGLSLTGFCSASNLIIADPSLLVRTRSFLSVHRIDRETASIDPALPGLRGESEHLLLCAPVLQSAIDCGDCDQEQVVRALRASPHPYPCVYLSVRGGTHLVECNEVGLSVGSTTRRSSGAPRERCGSSGVEQFDEPQAPTEKMSASFWPEIAQSGPSEPCKPLFSLRFGPNITVPYFTRSGNRKGKRHVPKGRSHLLSD